MYECFFQIQEALNDINELCTAASRKLVASLTGSQRVVTSITPPGTCDCDNEVKEAVILPRPSPGFKPGRAAENSRLSDAPDCLPCACSHAQYGPGPWWGVLDLLA